MARAPHALLFDSLQLNSGVRCAELLNDKPCCCGGAIAWNVAGTERAGPQAPVRSHRERVVR